MRILIADDSSVSRHLLDVTLRRWGYEVVMACDGSEAWAALEEPGAPAIAILDWVMPGMSGPEICKRIRQANREPYTYILLLTSKSDKEDLFEGMSAGADDYITKPFDQHELNARLRAGTRIVKLQAELLKAREALREQATHDSLTRAWNRCAILDIIHRELGRADREVRPVGVVLADLDYFKRVNDTWGHATGDAVLRETAARIQSSIRSYDSLGRYGGEEFLIVLPGCDHFTTVSQADRVRRIIASSPVFVEGQEIPITASFGCTASVPGRPEQPDRYIRAADKALYEAKRLGRNRVIFDDPDGLVTQLLIEGLEISGSR